MKGEGAKELTMSHAEIEPEISKIQGAGADSCSVRVDQRLNAGGEMGIQTQTIQSITIAARRAFSLLGFCVLLAIPVLTLAAAGGSISGTVTDLSGAVIAKVTVTTTNTETGVQESVISNVHAQYCGFGVLPLPPHGLAANVSKQKEIKFGPKWNPTKSTRILLQT